MQKIKNEFLMIAFIIVVILFFYFSAGVMIDRGLYVRMHGNGWAGSMSWRMYPATDYSRFEPGLPGRYLEKEIVKYLERKNVRIKT